MPERAGGLRVGLGLGIANSKPKPNPNPNPNPNQVPERADPAWHVRHERLADLFCGGNPRVRVRVRVGLG